MVPASERLVVGWRREQRDHLLLGQVCRHAHVALRRGDQRGGIVVDDAFAAQVAQEGADGGKLARRRRPRLAVRVGIGEETADRRPVERRRLEIAAPDTRPGGHGLEKLRKVALVGAHGVRRQIAIQAEKLQEALEMIDHGAPRTVSRCRDSIHPSRSVRARPDMASFRSIFPRGARASGSMMPNVMFDGS